MKLFSVKYWIKRLSNPLKGILYALRYDSAIQIEFVFGIVSLSILHFFFGPFTAQGQLLLLFCFMLVLITEFQNSAIETALDKIHPEKHHDIGLSKDLAAGAVIIAAVFSAISLYFVISGKI